MPTPNEKKKYTAEDFYKLVPETNERIELLDGEIVAQAAPSEIHQTITGRVFSRLDGHIMNNKGECKALISPFEVVLDDSNIVEPDVFVICDRSKLDGKRAHGAPDLVVEVVSSNRSDDFVRKLQMYKNSGVREYWIIDPSEECTIVYLFGETVNIGFYDFDQPIPVGIWDNKLEINIAELLI